MQVILNVQIVALSHIKVMQAVFCALIGCLKYHSHQLSFILLFRRVVLKCCLFKVRSFWLILTASWHNYIHIIFALITALIIILIQSSRSLLLLIKPRYSVL